VLDRTPDEVLADVGVRYLETILAPDLLGLHRLVIAEGMFMKDLAERFWETGPAHTRALLTEYFEQQNRRGTLRLDNSQEAAQQFWGMLLGSFQLECLLGLREPPGPEEIGAFVKTAVARFLDGCRANKA
jgi:TetR/AcrR family transcriptional repressor of mexJK operon